MLNAQLTIPQWLSLPINTRMKLVGLFNIPRSSGSLVQDNKVVSDGYTHDDLLHISVEKMQQILDSDETDFFKLFADIVANAEAIEEKEPLPQPPAWTLTEVPKDFVINIGGEDYVLVKKTERLGIVKSEDIQKIINGTDKPKAAKKHATKRAGGSRKRAAR